MGKISNYFKSTKYTTSWSIFYRNRPTGSILDYDKTPFTEYKLDKGFWAADPLLFEHNEKNYLFFELYDIKNKKGSIACAEIMDGVIGKYTKVLELDYHLSFPFVFEHNGCVYMIPETGATKSIKLFKAVNFPFEWAEYKTIVNNINSSDNVIYKDNEENIYLIASIMDGTPSLCHNEIYLLNGDLDVVRLIKKTDPSTDGTRNAGQLFMYNGDLIRPGQECKDMQYGRGLVFLKQIIKLNDSKEEIIKYIFPNDIGLISEGAHTYSSLNTMEIIDSKNLKKNNFISRTVILICKIFKRIFK